MQDLLPANTHCLGTKAGPFTAMVTNTPGPANFIAEKVTNCSLATSIVKNLSMENKYDDDIH